MDEAGAASVAHMDNDGGRDMLHRGSMTVNVALALCLVASQVSAEVFAYPKKGQSQQQFEQDQFGCHQWAKGQTGVDPTQPQASASRPAAPAGRGSARGGRVAPPSALSVGPSAVMRGRGRPLGPGWEPGWA